MNREQNIIDFYMLTNKLKDTIRTGWQDWHAKRNRIESVAEHIYGTQMLAIAMWSEFKYDIDIKKVIFMLALHELEECIIGDLTPFEITKSEKEKIGKDAVLSILQNLNQKEYLSKLLDEFNQKASSEAVFAFQCDKLECDLQCYLYDKEHCVNLEDKSNQKLLEIDSVREVIKEQGSWSRAWTSFSQKRYNYDKNFTKISNILLKK